MNPLRMAGAVLAAVAAILLVIVQFTPWGGIHSSIPIGSTDRVSFGADAYVWELKYEASTAGTNREDSKGWYASDFDDEEGAGKVRTGAPLLAVSLGLIVLGAVLQFALRPPFGSILTVLGVLVGVAGIIVFSVGVGDLFDDEQKWGAAFWMAIVAVGLGAIGAVLGMLPERLTPKFKSSGGPSF